MSERHQQQKEFCPECGEMSGWWSPLQKQSMVFHAADGETTERRLYESKRKQCANCNADITHCIR